MAVKVSIPTALRAYADNQSSVELESGKINDVLGQLVNRHPQLKTHLMDDSGKLRNFVNVYVNDENIRALDLDDTAVQEGDEVVLVPAVAGGATTEQPNTHPFLKMNPASAELSKEEIARFSRHLILPEVGMEGQRKLKAASILLVGTGGLGAPLGMYLSAAGIGRLGLVDFDVVDESNLQRQVIHGTKDVGRLKVESAKETITDLNPYTEVETYNTGLTSENALDIIRNYDMVIDGTDNFPTRYLVNDACVLLGKPNVYGSIFRFEGQSSVFWAERGPCYRCLYPEPPPPGMVPSCAEGGVIGILPGIVGLIQANEAVKLILEQGNPLIGRLLLFNALDMKFRELNLRKDPACPVCGENPTVTELIDYNQFCGVPAGGEAEEGNGLEIGEGEIHPQEVKAKLDAKENVTLVDVREPHEWEICHIEGAKLIPLSEIESRMGELAQDADIIVHCKMGGRSAKVQKVLQDAGYTKVLNMAGGITAWSDHVDPTVPKY